MWACSISIATRRPACRASPVVTAPLHICRRTGGTGIGDFNNNPNADLADFGPRSFVQSAFATEGIVPSYTTTSPDFPMMQSIGYDGFSSFVPEPASMILLGFGLAAAPARFNSRRAAARRDQLQPAFSARQLDWSE
jgi:hypothetical protein